MNAEPGMRLCYLPGNNAALRTGRHRGRPVRAMKCVREPGRNGHSCLAAGVDRQVNTTIGKETDDE